ncbi:F0F1 ATP synthase subunit epsilon [Cognatazoarcus halotolerans]|uniref:F0F1 ATP synthase subunit epsilon n=1 Tax=Cognatazoarcus halotolerans TaxID=2686016 RepID=UPI00135B8660|nr:F0F1 ATP synthase subunit epsilon [Cognatazoarcus halotolerans]MBX3681006.1 F0F1 ATP synthase subunit epsilon [Rhodocyclaceae bacterium]MCB1898703.1 F0F1 ATP synthase subunit epsilon [Rhodocyclaceae bacterium]MCP5310876.1 F0F1 ATP synthase subunit epsilon [Zoogloeaceae bacterium]HQV09495.1 F0F1 ATP synthase subunit epsilon [Thauera sp.]
MNTFTLQIASATRQERFAEVSSFVGSDASGQFGLMAGHVPMATVLDFGLARFRCGTTGDWRYLALPGGTLHFADRSLYIATRSYVVSDRLDTVRNALETQLAGEAQQRTDLRHNLDQLEKALVDRLWRMEAR